MTIITKLLGSLTSTALFLLAVLDIMQTHLGVDTQALLLGVGGGVGNVIAGSAAIFSDAITSIANWLAELTSAAPACEPDCATPSTSKLGGPSAVRSFAASEQNFELAVQLIVAVGALLAGYFMLRRQD